MGHKMSAHPMDMQAHRYTTNIYKLTSKHSEYTTNRSLCGALDKAKCMHMHIQWFQSRWHWHPKMSRWGSYSKPPNFGAQTCHRASRSTVYSTCIRQQVCMHMDRLNRDRLDHGPRGRRDQGDRHRGDDRRRPDRNDILTSKKSLTHLAIPYIVFGLEVAGDRIASPSRSRFLFH